MSSEDSRHGGGVRKPLSSRARGVINERDSTIASLHSEIIRLQNSLSRLTGRLPPKSKHRRGDTSGGSRIAGRKRRQPLHAHNIQEGSLGGEPGQGGRGNRLTSVRQQIGRNASISTSRALAALSTGDGVDCPPPDVCGRVLKMFRDPHRHVDYLKGGAFVRDLLELCARMRPLLEAEPRVVFLQSPCYVFGDLHGNLEDLHFFSDNVWRLGMGLTAGNFLFLGDYVDRGMSGLEVVAYLMAMKVSLPHKVHLLRGNHETRDVNGWEEHYGARSFISQCQRFGPELGYRVWEECNQVFDRLPLAAVIDQEIFCVHGGLPRGVSNNTQVEDVLAVSSVAGINPPYEHEGDAHQQVASDCIWSDPASEEQERDGVDPSSGFGESLRGGGAICFGNRAVTNFLASHGFSYILRAHEAHAEGVAVSKGARVFTVFSTSKDHNQGSDAVAGCILVDHEKMQVINRSPAYKNQYVHRRDSVSLTGMDPNEIENRAQLGLVTEPPPEEQHYRYLQDEDEDEWEEYEEDMIEDNTKKDNNDDDEDDKNYVLDTQRRSSVDPSTTVASPEDNKKFFRQNLGVNTSRGGGDGAIHTVASMGQLLSPLREGGGEEDEEDETSTVDGGGMVRDEDDNWEEAGEESNGRQSSSWRKMREQVNG